MASVLVNKIRFAITNCSNSIHSAEDPRVALYRLKKCRDHDLFSTLNAIALKQKRNLVVFVGKVGVTRALQGIHQVISVLASPQ